MTALRRPGGGITFARTADADMESRGLRSTIRTAGTTMEENGPRIPVTVHAPDPISRAGVVSQLRQYPVVELVEEPGDRPASVVLMLITETLDETVLSRLRELVRSGGMRAVLVVSLVREAELLNIIECGVGVVVWRHEATAQRLFQAVLAASRGDGDLPSDLLGRLINQVRTLQQSAVNHVGAPPSGLVPREVEVLRLVAEGMDTGEIAGKLSYSERTIKSVLHNLTTRLHLRNRAHAVAYAMRAGYI